MGNTINKKGQLLRNCRVHYMAGWTVFFWVSDKLRQVRLLPDASKYLPKISREIRPGRNPKRLAI